MKRKKKLLSVAVTIALVSLSIGCDEPESSYAEANSSSSASGEGGSGKTDNTVNASVFLDYIPCEQGGEITAALELDPSRSDANARISKATMYIDDEEVASINQVPFVFKYVLNTPPEKYVHLVVKYDVTDGEKTQTDNVFSSIQIHTIAPNETYSSFQLKATNGKYKSTESLKGIARVYQGSQTKLQIKLLLFLDGSQIAETATFPYELSTSLSNLSVGKHTIKERWEFVTSSGALLSDYERDRQIEITE